MPGARAMRFGSWCRCWQADTTQFAGDPMTEHNVSDATYALVLLGFTTALASGQTVVYNFGAGGPNDLLSPSYSGIIAQGRDGNLYSTAPKGGYLGSGGGIFDISPAGAYNVFWYFNSIFAGTASSGITLGSDGSYYESNIRRWVIENDGIEAIVALPLNLFYNTGIATYIWVLSNKKSAHRQGRIQLIDSTQVVQTAAQESGQEELRAVAAGHRAHQPNLWRKCRIDRHLQVKAVIDSLPLRQFLPSQSLRPCPANLGLTQQLRIDPRQPRQRPRIQPIVLLPALPDQPHVARMRHDCFVPIRSAVD